MQQNARFSALIELLQILYKASDPMGNPPADVTVSGYFRQRRFIGAGDRRYITTHFYNVVRSYWYWQGLSMALGLGNLPEEHPALSAEAALVMARSQVLLYASTKLGLSPFDIKSLFSGEKYAPKMLSGYEELILEKLALQKCPDLPEACALGIPPTLLSRFHGMFPESYQDEIKALFQEAPLDLRVNVLKSSRDKILDKLKKEGLEAAAPTKYSPWGIRIPQRLSLVSHPLYVQGMVEIQDEGSQLIAQAVDARPGMLVWDYCAGAGGKTLALAASMENKGRLIATDVVPWRLAKAPQRFRRAGVHNVTCRTLDTETLKWVKRHYNKCDRVLVDAPCSGTGTWRRNPDLIFRFSEQTLLELCVKQQEILEEASLLVKVGGRLIYATCSLLDAENQDQIEKFCERHPEFKVVNQGDTENLHKQLTPYQHGTDGFFVAVLEKIK